VVYQPILLETMLKLIQLIPWILNVYHTKSHIGLL